MLGGVNNNFLTILNKTMLDAEPLMGQQAKENQIIAALTARLTADAIEEVLQGVIPRHYLPTRQLDYKNKPRAFGVIYEKFDEHTITPQQSVQNSLANTELNHKRILENCYKVISSVNNYADYDYRTLMTLINEGSAYKQCFVITPLLMAANSIASALDLKTDENTLVQVNTILLQGIDVTLDGVKFKKEAIDEKLSQHFNLTARQKGSLNESLDNIRLTICKPLREWLPASDKLLEYIDEHNDDDQKPYNHKEWSGIIVTYQKATLTLLEHLEAEQQRLDWSKDDKKEFKENLNLLATIKKYYEQQLDTIIGGFDTTAEQLLCLEKKIRLLKSKLDADSDNELVQFLSSMHIEDKREEATEQSAEPVDVNKKIKHLPYNPLVERNSSGDNAFILLARKKYFRAIEALFNKLKEYYSPGQYLQFAPLVLRANEAGETILGFALKYENFDYAREYLDKLGERTLKGTSLNAKILSNMWGCVNGWTFNAHSPHLVSQLEIFKAMLTHRLFDAKAYLSLSNAEPILITLMGFKGELKDKHIEVFEEVGDTLEDVIEIVNKLVDKKREHACKQQPCHHKQERTAKVRGLRA